MSTGSSYKKYKHEKLDFSRFILDPVDKPGEDTVVKPIHVGQALSGPKIE
ncbi:MAG TPA: palindromic element RPE4 domain-containing protein [Rickettsia endosymbiont of Bembidion lapponicum]|nr:palindromic element RPE4 domain-containing protein [Rickettsia endosymbiont of Bembidion lapponicum]